MKELFSDSDEEQNNKDLIEMLYDDRHDNMTELMCEEEEDCE